MYLLGGELCGVVERQEAAVDDYGCDDNSIEPFA